MSIKKPQLVVIGNGMAGMRTVEELISAAPDHYDITVFGVEPQGNYNRVLLSAVRSGEKKVEEIIIHDRDWYHRNQIRLEVGVGKAVTEIKRGMSQVICQDGSVTPFDRLLIATGSRPLMPDLPGIHLKGVMGFRNLRDVETMLHYSLHHSRAIVLGGGLLGLEAAHGLAQRGMSVTVLHNHAKLLNKQLDGPAAAFLKRQLEDKGIMFEMAVQLTKIHGDSNAHVHRVQLHDGRELPCDLLICAIGIRPEIQLAKDAGLYCERGIVVNDTLQTYDPSIYAVGECIQHRGETFGLVAPLYEQARICANHLAAHGMGKYKTPPLATQLKVSGIDLFSVGDFHGDESCELLEFNDPALGVYKKVVIKNKQLLGAVLYGDTANARWYQQLIDQQADISGLRQQLLFGQSSIVAAYSH